MAASIIGRSFEPFVKKQIAKRQEKLGLGLKDLDVFKFENTNAPFIRLTSGVNVNADALQNLGLAGQTKYGDNGLAKQFKLFSARTATSDGEAFTSGFGYNDQSSYGFMSNPDYGYVPPPGIISMDVKAMNRGSLREANIEIQCHNLQQFQIIEVLYLRLKYSILLEWGHSIYFDNSGNLQQNRFDLSDTFLKGGIDQQGILNLVRKTRRESNGNYDAFFGLVTNFSWTLRPDGGYNVTLTARSTGDVIESLKMNTSYPVPQGSTTPNIQENDPNKKQDPPPSSIQTNYYKSTINRILTLITSYVNPTISYAHGVNQGNGQYTPMDNYSIEQMSGLKAICNRDSQTETANATDHLTWKEILMFTFPQTLSGGTWGNRQYYMKLGTLLRIIESFLLCYDTTKLNNSQQQASLIQSVVNLVDDLRLEEDQKSIQKILGYSPLFKIDYNYNNNFCLTFPRHCSIDPKVCLIPISLDEIQTGEGSMTGPFYIDTVYTYLTISYATSTTGTNNSNTTPISISQGDSSFLELQKAAGLDVYQNSNAWRDEPQPLNAQSGNLPSSLPIFSNNNSLVANLEAAFAAGQNSESDLINGYNVINSISSPANARLQSTPSLNVKYIVDVDTKIQFLKNINSVSSKIVGQAATEVTTTLTGKLEKKSIVVREYRNPNQTVVYDQSLVTPGSELYTQIKDSGFKTPDKPYVGNLMHMYLNMEFIASTLDKYIDISEGKISLYDFLDNIMKGAQSALGNVNNFEIIYDEDNNSYRIIDNTFIPGLGGGEDSGIVQFNANILKNNYGSFISNVNFRTKLSNNFATMTTVGAQSNGNVVGENSTALSKWNVGLTDRIITDRANPNGTVTSGSSVADKFLQNVVNLQQFNGKVNAFQLTDNDISSLKGGIVDLFKMEIGEFTNQGKIPGIGFIPFDLELTMLGLSGPKIYETYTIDTTLLPNVYKDKVQFICSGVSHKVSDNGWITTLNSICGPRYDGVTISNPPNIKNITKVEVPKSPEQDTQGNGLSTPPSATTGVYEIYTQNKLRKNYFDITKHHSYNSLKTHSVTPPGSANTTNWTVSYRKSNYIGHYSKVSTYSNIVSKNKNEDFVVFDWVLKRDGKSDVLVPAPFNGKVVAGGLKSGGGATTYGGTNVVVDSGGNSYYALISTDGSKTAIFLHMREMYFKVGDTFNKGQGLGIQASVGPTSTGTHLHIEAMTLQDSVDYFNFINSLSANYDGKTTLT
jgi:hypothetical protein